MKYKNLVRNFSTTTSGVKKNQLYMWLSNVNPGRRKDDYKNFLILSNLPRKMDFFDDKNPKDLYMGPRHSGVVTESGDLYTFGTGNWGVLGHGNENNVPHTQPRLVEYFYKNNIKVKKVCMGDFHTMALAEDGSVYTWGFGGKKGYLNTFFAEAGALGHGDKMDTFIPKKVRFFEKNNIVVKDIGCGIRHSVALSGIYSLFIHFLDSGEVYTWGRGEYGLLGNGTNKDCLIPTKNEYLEMYLQENPENKVVKVDCADEYSGALTQAGNLYVWGKNNQGQLGIGAGIGIDYTESEKFPTPVVKPKEIKYVDFSCGENCMMMRDDQNLLHKTGWRIDYLPSVFQISKTVNAKLFFCGNSYYCMVDENGKIYQWGNLFKQSKTEKTDSDMSALKDDPFEGKQIVNISGRFKICGAIVQDK
jgi:alpha-tubulin suppressor-like RCC1 family protein